MPEGEGKGIPRTLALSATLVTCLMLPASAGAAQMDSYADDDAVNDSTPCSQADPCQHIAAALADTLAGGTVHVAPGTYNEALMVTGGKSLLYDGSGVSFGAVINGSASPAVTIDTGQSAGTIRGFTLRSTTDALQISGSGTVSGNLFDSTNASSIAIGTSGADPKTISGNQITGNGTADRSGIFLSGSATVSQNLFSGLNRNIFLTGGSPLIQGNEFGAGVPSTSVGIQVQGGATGGNPVITGNYLHEIVTGVVVQQLANPAPVGAALSRNRLLNNGVGLSVEDTLGAVSLDSDLLVGNGTAILTNDFPATAGDQGNTTATNITLWGGSFGGQLFNAQLTLDSSIVGAAGFTNNGTNGSCSISNSRGAAINPADTSGCSSYQTTADPQFVDVSNPDPTLGDYHLAAGSPMIDQGNPIEPPAGTLDLDGDVRALAGTCGATVRRDIGADEFNPNCPAPPTAPASPAPSAPPTPSAQCAGKNATVAGARATISGTPGNDRITGTPAADVIDGAGGNDTIRGLGGNDTICGDQGKDRLIGGVGNDKLIGGPGKDTLKGGPGKDKLAGGPGKDVQVQ